MIIEIMDWILLGLLQQKSEIIKGIFLYLIGRYWYIICYIPLIALLNILMRQSRLSSLD